MDASIFLGFLYSQFFVKPAYPTQSCAGQTYIVTGANIGLGLEAARHLVRLGAEKVILACRSASKGEEAKQSIEKSEKKSGVVEVWELDLGDFDSIRAFAKRVQGLKRIDAIIENAGVAVPEFKLVSGNETNIAVNVIGTFLLALLVLPTLERVAKEQHIQPRLTIVSSEVHTFTHFPERTEPVILDALNSKEKSNMDDRYPVSKLLQVFAVRELASAQPQPPVVIINCLNPGFCHSGLSRDAGGLQAVSFAVMKFLLARTTEVGSRTLVAGALAGPESHGQYLSDCKVTPPAKLVRSGEGEAVQKKVWSEVAAKLEQIEPGILKNL